MWKTIKIQVSSKEIWPWLQLIWIHNSRQWCLAGRFQTSNTIFWSCKIFFFFAIYLGSWENGSLPFQLQTSGLDSLQTVHFHLQRRAFISYLSLRTKFSMVSPGSVKHFSQLLNNHPIVLIVSNGSLNMLAMMFGCLLRISGQQLKVLPCLSQPPDESDGTHETTYWR